ncbi:MAG: hypothetical protein ACPG7F_01330 [Aggregatilineales bacterium]
MFKFLRRLTLFIAGSVFLVCFVLLLNITASNPTGRRYSSEIPLRTGEDSSPEIGRSGERILANDLGLANNNDTDFRQCVCESGAGMPGGCNVCLVNIDNIGKTFRIPDFVGGNFIAESKNTQVLRYSNTEIREQLTVYARMASALDVPLWIYTRIDTRVDTQYITMAESTGGGLVKYFSYPGYLDPVDEDAKKVGVIASIVIATLLLLELLIFRLKRVKLPAVPHPSLPARKSNPRTIIPLLDDDLFMQDIQVHTEVHRRKKRLQPDTDDKTDNV